ncbi:hypothetical protein ES703_109143 [subsurface metagenome]
MAKKIELELSDELYARLKRVADKTALPPGEVAKFILAHELAREKTIDWMWLINKGREFLGRIIRESRET